jgi:NAD dependent epimerase/dehydratase family enzyme
MMSWIHIDDLCRMYSEALSNEMVNGVYNAVAPNPTANRDFTIGLAKLLKGNFFLPFHVPSFLLKILFGGVSIELLKSVQVSSEKITKTGFQFLFPSIEAALQDLCRR